MPEPLTREASVAPQEPPGSRFAFGRNWRNFLSTLDEQRIRQAGSSLRASFACESLEGARFLDAGCGSGLFSLAARRLGAEVVSFDYDPESVACAEELKRRHDPSAGNWSIGMGSVLDRHFLRSLGTFDFVYAWGVLHHTGDMWGALDDILLPLASPGKLCIAIYNDQGALSRVWRLVKRCYCSGEAGRWLVTGIGVPGFALRAALAGLITRGNPLDRFRHYRSRRGMSIWHDWIDWLGGYPFEVATPGQIFRFYRDRGLQLAELATTNRSGCNEFLFVRPAAG